MRAALVLALAGLTLASCKRKLSLPPPPDIEMIPDRYVQMVKTPEQRGRRPAVEDEVVKYDDAEWHQDSAREAKLPEEAAATHIGMFLAWVVTRRLDAGPRFAEGSGSAALDEANDRDDVRRRKMKGAALLRRWYDDKLFSEELTPEGAAFANAYYVKHYFDDYNHTLAKGLASEYAVPDTWESFDKLAPVIDHRFAAWKAKHPKAGR